MVSVNLIPESIRAAQTRRRHLKTWTALTVVAAAASAVPIAAHWSQHVRRDELQALNEQLQADLTSARGELRTVTAEAGEVVLRLERANALRAKRSWSSLVALLASNLPDECWLISLATDPDVPSAAPPVRKGAAPAPPVPAGGAPALAEKAAVVTIDAPRKLRLIGQAADATGPLAFASRLKDTRVFSAVTLERSQRESAEQGTYFKFELICEW